MDATSPDLLHHAEQTIQSFYNCQDPKVRQEAHNWLLQLLHSNQAWSIAWLLASADRSVQAQYYGLNILHFRLSKDWANIPEDARGELKQKFLYLFASLQKSPKLVTAKLCTAYGTLLIHSAKENSSLVASLQEVESVLQRNGTNPQGIVLELLTVLPNELKNLILEKQQRFIVREMLETFVPTLLSFCTSILQSSEDVGIKHDMLKCMLVWIEFGVSLGDVEGVLPLIFSYVSDSELSDEACEVLIELITAPTSYRYSQIILNFTKKVLELNDIAHKCLRDGDMDLLKNLCMLYTSLGETHCKLFIKSTDAEYQSGILNLVKMLLEFTAVRGFYPTDETCSETTFNFWYTLQDDILSLEPEEMTGYHHYFVEAYMALIQILSRKAQYPPDDVYSKFSGEEKEQFRCYRIDIQDTVLYVHNLLRERCLQFFAGHLQQLLADLASSTWQQIEAILYLVQGAAESIDPEESVFVPQILSMLSALPNHPVLQETAILMVGTFSEWLNYHPNDFLPVLPLLLQGLAREETSWSCSIALKDICQDCAMLFKEDSIMEILQTCCACLNQGRLKPKVLVRLVEIGGYVIAALPWEKILAQLETIVLPLFNQLEACLQEKPKNNESRLKMDHIFNCFLGLLRSVDPYEEAGNREHPVVSVFSKLATYFPLLKPWIVCEGIALGMMSCVSRAVEVSREKLAPLMPATCDIIVEFFNLTFFSCFLDGAALIVGMFSSESICQEKVRTMFVVLCDLCLAKAMSKTPDCVQSFMNLLTRVLKTDPALLTLDTARLTSSVQFSMSLLIHQESPTISSACHFLVTFANQGTSCDSAKNLFVGIGQALVFVALSCIGGQAPRQVMDHFAELLLALNKNFSSELSVWLSEVLNSDRFHSGAASQGQKENFQRAVLRIKSNKKRMKEVVEEFSLVCRGLHGTAYAAS